jgi:hypothetical protein
MNKLPNRVVAFVPRSKSKSAFPLRGRSVRASLVRLSADGAKIRRGAD